MTEVEGHPHLIVFNVVKKAKVIGSGIQTVIKKKKEEAINLIKHFPFCVTGLP
jgi:hypothetical protein